MGMGIQRRVLHRINQLYLNFALSSLFTLLREVKIGGSRGGPVNEALQYIMAIESDPS